MTGVNIAEMIAKQGRLPVDDAVNYTLQITSALVHTSERGVVHRDIKPSNIIITPKGRAKLVDMGLARNENRDSSADLTVAGTTLGTFDYISPEQAKDPRAVDVRSDIYSLGCTLYHMLTGEAPYPGGTMLQQLLDHQGKDAPDPAAKNPYVSDDLSAVVRKMMASDPKRRYQTADELMRDLMLVAGAMGLRSLNPEGLVWMSSRPLSAPFWERHLPWMSTFAALIILVTVASILPGRLAPEPTNTDGTGEVAEGNAGEKVTSDDGGQEVAEPPDTSGTENPVVKSNTSVSVPEVPQDPKTGASLPEKKIAETSPDARSLIPKNTNDTMETGSLPDSLSLGPEPGGKFQLGPSADADSAFALLPPLPAELTEPRASRPAERNGTDNRTTAKPTAAAGADIDRPFTVLGVDGAMDHHYRSLEAACTDAVDGSKIELRYNGVRRESRRIRIEGKRITIRAAAGYQPTLELTPNEAPAADYRDHFISVSGGALEMANVHIALAVNEAFPSDRWSIFSLEHPESVQMDGVTVTVRNRDQRRQVAVFELTSGTNFSDMPIPDADLGEPLQITIARCVFRGGCDFLAVRQQAGARVTVEDTLFALAPVGAVVRVFGGTYEPDDDAAVELRLNHCTVMVSSGLLAMSSDTVPHKLIPVQITATNNMISGFGECPLVSMTGRAPVQDFRDLIRWSGTYNYYDRFTDFWQTQSDASDDGWDALNFDDWQNWRTIKEVDAYNDVIYWQDVWRDMPAETITPANVRLDPTQFNRAEKGTATLGQAGAHLAELPMPPEKRNGRRP